MTKGIICLGEALVDFIPLDKNNQTFQKSPGGAPANVAVGLARLGAKTTFLGKVGDDVLGHFLFETLTNYGVDTSSMLFTENTRTGISFVTLGEGGERCFEFYIDPSADRFLEKNEIDKALFQEHNLIHFGSISLISEPAKSATKKAVQLAKENGLLVSYDPNLRLGLWKSEEQARKEIRSMFGTADILKLSSEELAFITGEANIEKGVKKLDSFNIPIILITLGSNGSHIFMRGIGSDKVEAFKVKAVDATGAGDAFVSAILYQLHLIEKPIAKISLEDLKKMARFASISGGLAASSKGAMTALPTLSEIHKKMAE